MIFSNLYINIFTLKVLHTVSMLLNNISKFSLFKLGLNSQLKIILPLFTFYIFIASFNINSESTNNSTNDGSDLINFLRVYYEQMVYIDSVKFNYDETWPGNPQEIVMLYKNGDVRVVNGKSIWTGKFELEWSDKNIFFDQKAFYNKLPKHSTDFECEKGRSNYTFYSKDSIWEMTCRPCFQEADIEVSGVVNIIHNILDRTIWNNEIPPMFYNYYQDTLSLRLDIENTRKKLNRLENQLKSLHNNKNGNK